MGSQIETEEFVDNDKNIYLNSNPRVASDECGHSEYNTDYDTIQRSKILNADYQSRNENKNIASFGAGSDASLSGLASLEIG